MRRLGLFLLVTTACGRVAFDVVPIDAVSTVGCSDGEREGYVDDARFATIAACSATWVGDLDLRAAPTGALCGDDLGSCAVPADACAPGWHICAHTGDVTELQILVASEFDDLLEGRYVAASAHCSNPGPCAYLPLQMFGCPVGTQTPCTQPICCGTRCAVPACQDGVWPGRTRENVFVAN